MKLSILTILFLCICTAAQAQNAIQQHILSQSNPTLTFADAVDSVYRLIAAEMQYDTTEGGALRTFHRWSKFMEDRVCFNAPLGVNRLTVSSKIMHQYLRNLGSGCIGNTTGLQGDWQCLGPYLNSYNNGMEHSGRVDALWVNPTNPDTILVGAASGGIWKSVNGGQDWFNITDGANHVLTGTTGIHKITVNPLNPKMIYASTGQSGLNKNTYGYTAGVIYSSDNGLTWRNDVQADTIIAKQNDYWDNVLTQLDYMPGTDKLFAVYKDSVYVKAFPNATWQNITPPIDSGNLFTDMQFTHNSPCRAVFKTSAKNGISKLWILDQSNNWSSMTINLDTSIYFQTSCKEESISISNNDKIFLNISKKTPGKLLVQYDLNSTFYTILNNNLDNYQFVVVSPMREQVFYATTHTGGGYDLSVSYDKGATFSSGISSNIHADVRCVTIYSSVDTFNGIKDRVFAGTDGGVVCKHPYQSGFSSITGSGLCISQMYGFANTENDEGILEGGSQDNGSYTWVKQRTPQWIGAEYYGDNYLTSFQKNGRTAYTEGNFPEVGKFTFHPNNYTSFSFDSQPDDGRVPPNSGYDSDLDGWIDMWHEHCQDTRPLYFLDSNIYIGVYYVWKKSNKFSSWQHAFVADPIMPTPSDSNFVGRMVRDFIFHEKNDSVVYVAYKRPAYHNPTESYQPVNPYAKLFVAKNAIHSIPSDASSPLIATWENITPDAVEWQRIMDIESDPANPARIWVALGEIDWGKISIPPSQMSNRIKYSPDYGSTWVDISAGLPALPVNKIVYQAGSDDVLYAGTDVGVFKWNKSKNQWECFNHNFPNCIVSNMEINYCAGKLRVSTMGRGIWETDLLQSGTGSPMVGDITPFPQEEVSSDTTRSNDPYIQIGIRITNDAIRAIQNFTVSQTVIHMPRNGKIVVEAGAKLVVDGAKITNDCEGFWFGIEALGNSSQPQSSTAQAEVQLQNGAVIEHARFGLSNWDHQNLQSTGARLFATNSFFLNNRKSVELEKYHHLGSSNYYLYSALFSNCVFRTDNDYRGDAINYGFDSHVSMWEVESIRFSGCRFLNTKTTGISAGNGYGLVSYNAGFHTNTYNNQHTLFRGFKAGILAQGDALGLQQAISIQQTDFDSNSVGVWVENVDNFLVRNSQFQIGRGKPLHLTECFQNIGIYSSHSHQFSITSNSFLGYAGSSAGVAQTIGVVTVESGATTKEIGQNVFSGMSIGAAAIGKNSSPYGSLPFQHQGLRYQCNQFTDNMKDIVVSALDPKDGIADIQGSILYSAANQFISGGTFYNGGHPIVYYNNGGTALPVFFGNIVSVSSPPRNCGVGYPDDGYSYPLNVVQESNMVSSLYAGIRLRQTKDSVYRSIMDNGNLANVMNYLNGQTRFNAIEVRDFILGLSPYLSDSLIRHLALSGLLPAGMLFDALAANPDALRNPDVMNALLEGMELTMQELSYLESLAFSTVLRGTHEAEISDAAYAVHYLLNTLLTNAKSSADAVSQDSVIHWLRVVGEPWADSKAAYLLLLTDSHSLEADSLLSAIPTRYGYSTESVDLFAQTEAVLWSVIQSLKLSSRTVLELSEEEKQKLTVLSQNYPNSDAGAQATTILNNLAGNKILPCVELGGVLQKLLVSKPPATSGGIVQVFPNPAHSYVLFRTGNRAEIMSLEITDALGKTTHQAILPTNNTQYVWDVRNLSSGAYLWKIKKDTKIQHTGTLVIAH
ncbi:MAG: T9SS type A sorting domain-containing protein [Bacteroidetes bacterium]|nr:T9SS type A sorting domain-containing protein [Bacteroidota bacterium]